MIPYYLPQHFDALVRVGIEERGGLCGQERLGVLIKGSLLGGVIHVEGGIGWLFFPFARFVPLFEDTLFFYVPVLLWRCVVEAQPAVIDGKTGQFPTGAVCKSRIKVEMEEGLFQRNGTDGTGRDI